MRVWCDRFDGDGFPKVQFIDFSSTKTYEQTATNKQLKLVKRIDQFVKNIYAKGGGDEELLTNMQPYMNDFKKVMDNSFPDEMDAFYEKYDGFHSFAELLQDLAGAIQEGIIDVPE